MKSIFIILISLLLSMQVFAQIKYTEAIDFTLISTQGVEVNLFDELDNGKTVLLSFFSTTCGSCVLEAPKVDSIYQQFGSGTEQLLVWGIASPSSPLLGIQNFIEETEITYPCFETGHAEYDVFDLYGILYTPQIYIICDYSVSESISFFEIIENLDYCFPTKIDVIEVYPNLYSLNGHIFIENTFNETISVQVFDITGKEIINDRLKSGMSSSYDQFNLNQIYIVNILSNSGKSQSQKILVK
ncbi:MAG: redoxin domain-containing protein [Bacteroidales bacterium]|nr:redoxin domain-containing protein [Bacteroidales bacterium]